MKTVTLILRMRFDEHDLYGALEDPVSGWHAVFTDLDGLGALLRQVRRHDPIKQDGSSIASPETDGQDEHNS